MIRLGNSNGDKTKKNQIVTKIKKSNGNKTQIVTWQNSKTQIVTKLKNSNYDKTWIMTNLKLQKEKEKFKSVF